MGWIGVGEMYRTWHVLSTYWFGKMAQLCRIAHIWKVICVRVWNWSIQTQSGKQIVFPAHCKGRLISRVPSVSVSVKEHEVSNSSNAELAINVLCKHSFLVPDFSSHNSNAFVCYQLLSAKHFANIQITCLLLNEPVVNQLQQHLVPSVQRPSGRELAFSLSSERKTLTALSFLLVMSQQPRAEIPAGTAWMHLRGGYAGSCLTGAAMCSVCPEGPVSKCFVSGQVWGVGRQLVLLNCAPDTCFSCILAGYGKAVSHYCSILHASSAGRGKPLEQLSLAVRRNKALFVESPLLLF